MIALPVSLFASVVALQSSDAPPAAAADPSIAARGYRRIERRANEFTASAQEAVALDLDAAGRAVVAWQSRRQEEGTYGVYARRFEADGTPTSAEVHLNATTASQQTRPAVAVDAAGAWFVWESFGQDGDQGSIVARRFDPALARSSAEVLVNEGFAAGHQDAPVVASDASGNAVVAWATDGETGERWILARRFGASAEPIGPAFRVDSAAGFRDSVPCVGMEASGGFTIAWARARAGSGPEAGKPAGIHARRYDAAGVAVTGEVEISPRDGRQHIEPSLAVGSEGQMALAWFTSRGEDFGVTVRTAKAVRVQPEGPVELALGPVREVETGTAGYSSGLAIARAGDGRLLIAWSGFGDAQRKSDLFARVLRADGEADPEPVGKVFRVSAAAKDHQMLQPASGACHARFLDDGRMAFGWSGNADLGDSNAAHLTLLAPEGFEFGRIAPAAAVESEPPAFAAAAAVEERADAATPEDHEPPTFNPRDRLSRYDPGIQQNLAGPDFGFLGVVNTGWTPPDPHLSVGPGHVVLITNGAIQFMQKDGTLNSVQPIEGPGGFWGAEGAGGFVFDPETCYDPHTDRFMAMACERTGNQSFFLYAVSDDSDPNGTWFKYRFNVTALAGGDIDSPELAVDSQAVYLCADFFTPGDKFLVFIVEKGPTLSGGVPITRSHLITGTQSYGVPVTYGTPPAQYMIEALEAASNTQIRLHAIRNPLTAPTDTTVLINVPAYQQPEDPPQMGTTSRPITFESRFWSCMYRNGSLWATHHTGSARVLQRWYQIDMGNWPTSGTPTVVQQGDIDPGPTIRTFFGSIWADADDNAGMVFARTSPSEFISMGRTFRRASDPLGTMTPMVIVHNSTSPDTSNRWGDYSNVAADPVAPGAFWGHHEFRTSSWMTWVDLFGPCEPPTSYCTAKLNSVGQLPFLSSTGEASVGANNFAVVLNNALPNKLGLVFYSDNPDSTPFAGGTRCVAPPLHRGGTFTTDALGTGIAPHAVTLPMLGNDRYFQLFSRDPQIPDGTGLSLSDGLRVVFCP